MSGLESDREITQQIESWIEPLEGSEIGFTHKTKEPGYPVPLEMRKEAIEEFDKEQILLSKSANEEDQILNNAILLHKNGEDILAQSLLREILRKDPMNVRAIDWLGRIALRSGNIMEAEKFLRIAAQIDPKAENYLAYGDVLFKQGKDREALIQFFEALDTIEYECPLLFDIYKSIGNSYVRLGDLDAAEENYNKAYTLNPDSDVLLVNYGTLEIQRNNIERAVERFRQAVAINAENDKAWVGLALTHRQFGDIELAWGNLERALDLNPKSESGIQLLVDWSVRDSKLIIAIERLEKFLNYEMQNVEVMFILSKILFLAGRLNAALMEMEKALAFEPHLPGGVEFLSQIRGEIGRRHIA